MMSILRDMLRSKLAVVIIGLLIVSMAVWGITDIFVGGSREGLITAGKRSLSVQAFNTRVDTYLRNVQEQTGEVILRRDMAEDGTLDQFLSSEVNRIMVLGYAAKLGATASAEAVREDARSTDAFKDAVTGEFTERSYLQTLAQAGFSVKAYEQDVRDQLTRTNLDDALGAGVKVPDILAAGTYDYYTEVRDAAAVSFPASMIPTPDEPTEEDIAAYFEANAERFAIGERRAISVLSFSAEDFTAAARPEDDEIQALYDADPKRFSGPESRTFTEFFYADENTAGDAMARLSIGDSVESLPGVLQPGETRTLTATQDKVEIQLLGRDLFGALASEGAFFGPYASGNRYVIARVDALIDGELKPLDEVREQIVQQVSANRAVSLYYDAVDALNRDLSAGLSVYEIGAELGIPVLSYPPVTDRGMDKDGRTYAGVTAYAEPLQQAFTLRKGDFTDPSDDKSSTVVMVVEDVLEPFTPELEDVRDIVDILVRRERLGNAVRDFSTALQERVTSGESTLEDEAAKAGLVVQEFVGLTRQNVPRDADGRILNAIFGLEAGEVTAIANSTGGVSLVRLDRTAKSVENRDEIMSQIRMAMLPTLVNDLYVAALTDARDEIKPEVDEPTYAALREEALGNR